MLISIKNLIIASVFVLVFSSCSENNKRAYKQLEQENTRLATQLDSLSQRMDSVINEQSIAQLSGSRTDLLSESDIEYFRSRGLDNPVEDLKTDLSRNSKLIPVEGSLGGTMQFYKEKINVLNRQWVMAYFEDGHNAGEMLLEFKIGNNGIIAWKVLSTNMM